MIRYLHVARRITAAIYSKLPGLLSTRDGAIGSKLGGQKHRLPSRPRSAHLEILQYKIPSPSRSTGHTGNPLEHRPRALLRSFAPFVLPPVGRQIHWTRAPGKDTPDAHLVPFFFLLLSSFVSSYLAGKKTPIGRSELGSNIGRSAGRNDS